MAKVCQTTDGQAGPVTPEDIIGCMLDTYWGQGLAQPTPLRSQLRAIYLETNYAQELLQVLQSVYRAIDDHDYDFALTTNIPHEVADRIVETCARLGIVVERHTGDVDGNLRLHNHNPRASHLFSIRLA